MNFERNKDIKKSMGIGILEIEYIFVLTTDNYGKSDLVAHFHKDSIIDALFKKMNGQENFIILCIDGKNYTEKEVKGRILKFDETLYEF